MKKIVRYFAQGLIVLVPVTITVLVIYKIFSWFLSLFTHFATFVNPWVDPIIILLVLIGVIVLTGIFASSVVAGLFMGEVGKLLEKMPVVKLIYSPVKDFTSAFFGNKKRFSHPVLVVTNAQTNIREIGFVTHDDLTELGISKEKVAVYIPHSYAISGRLLIVPRENVEPLNVPVSEAMKFIVSGGVTDVEEH